MSDREINSYLQICFRRRCCWLDVVHFQWCRIVSHDITHTRAWNL